MIYKNEPNYSYIEKNPYNNSSITHFYNNQNVINEYRRNQSSYTAKYFTGKLTSDGLYYIFDNRKKPEFNKQYANNMFKNYLSRYAVKNGVKLLLTSTNPLKSIKYIRVGMSGISELKNYSQNMLNNVDYLKSNNMFNSHNLAIVHKQSAIMSGFNVMSSDLSFRNNIIGNATLSLIDIGLDKSYIPTPCNMLEKCNYRSLNIYDNIEKPIYKFIVNGHNTINDSLDFMINGSQNMLNQIDYYNKNLNLFTNNNNINLFIAKPIYELIVFGPKYVNNSIDYINNSIDNIINNSLDNIIDYGGRLIHQSIEFINGTVQYSSYSSYNSIINNNKLISENNNNNNSTIIIDNSHNTSESNTMSYRNSNSWVYDDYYNCHTFMDLAFDNANNKLNTTLENTENNIEKAKEKEKNLNLLDINELNIKLSNLSKFINVCNVLKNLDLTDINTILELQSILVNLMTPDVLVNGVFRFIIDNTMHTKDKLETMLNLMVAVSEKYLEIPLTNAFNFVKNLFERKSVKEYLTPLLLDLTSLLVPGINIINIVVNIIKGIEHFFSKQSIKRVNGIEFLCIDKFKIGFFRIKHKISYKNDFFGIDVSFTSRKASDANKLCKDEFIKQLDHKVYQVIGIPIEFINGSIETPITRYGLYAQKFYIEDLEKYWLKVNDPYLSEEDKNIINALYFESQTNKEYRYELAQRGEKPSWYWEHKNDTIGNFIYNLVDFMNSNNFTIRNLKQIINSIFNNTKTNITNNIENIDIFDNLENDEHYKSFINNFSVGDMLTIINSIFNNTNITKNESLKDQENKNQNDIFTKAKNQRTTEDNQKLDNFRDSLRQSYIALIKNDSGGEIMRRARLELWHTQKTVEYIAQCGYSSFIGHFGLMLSYIDYEIVKLKNPVYFTLGHIGGYLTNLGQGYLTRVLVDQSCLYVSLLSQTEHLTDEYLLNYINPAIACLVGLGLGIIKYSLPSNKEEPKSFKNVLINGGVSAVNTSFGMIYNYIKPRVFIKYLTNISSKCVNGITNVIKYVFRLSLTVDFVGAVSLNVLFNVGMRLLNKLYVSRSYIEDNPIYNDIDESIYNNIDDSIYNDIDDSIYNYIDESIYNDIDDSIYNYIDESIFNTIKSSKNRVIKSKKNIYEETFNESYEETFNDSYEETFNETYEINYNISY
jgi:hypothetical protein